MMMMYAKRQEKLNAMLEGVEGNDALRQRIQKRMDRLAHKKDMIEKVLAGEHVDDPRALKIIERVEKKRFRDQQREARCAAKDARRGMVSCEQPQQNAREVRKRLREECRLARQVAKLEVSSSDEQGEAIEAKKLCCEERKKAREERRQQRMLAKEEADKTRRIKEEEEGGATSVSVPFDEGCSDGAGRRTARGRAACHADKEDKVVPVPDDFQLCVDGGDQAWPSSVITRLYLDGNNMLFVPAHLRALTLKGRNRRAAEAKLAAFAKAFGTLQPSLMLTHLMV
eukprot:TRINITY_DN18_c0_g1_i3.p1 TRINITY_DN18_c0_g1~~TRINITY_DN18_c0_g1_i3.p1  ORF type:complete len:284 (+),score=71.42 TRINITY_DN18_c0_g1_i3:67-918(+)